MYVFHDLHVGISGVGLKLLVIPDSQGKVCFKFDSLLMRKRNWSLTLLWYHEKRYLNSTMGSI